MDLSELMLAAGHRQVLHCADLPQREQLIDQLCQQLQAKQQRYALLLGHGALISNLSTIDNVLLAAAWQPHCNMQALLQRMHEHLATLGFASAASQQWLSKRPSQLSAEQTRAAVMVRALLLEPTVLVCDESWFVDLGRNEMQLLARAEPLWQQCSWLVVGTGAVENLPAADWHHVELPSLHNELSAT